MEVLGGSTSCPPPALQAPWDEKTHSIAACPTPTAAVGLVVTACAVGLAAALSSVPNHAVHGLPFPVAEAVHVSKAGPGIKNTNPPGAGCVGRVCSRGWPGCGGTLLHTVSVRRGEAIWAFMETGRGLLNKELVCLGFFYYFLFLTYARAARQPAQSCTVLVPTPSACCRAGCPPPIPGERHPELGGWRGNFSPSTYRPPASAEPSCEGCPEPRFPCLGDDEPSPN